MERIQTCLWFDGQAEDAARFHASVFPGSEVGKTIPYGKAAAEVSGNREGAPMTVEYSVAGHRFVGLNGGPHFKLNPSISFFVSCESERELDAFWGKLAKVTRMEAAKYPFADRYGWCEDRFGVNWQLFYKAGVPPRKQKLAPALLFTNEKLGQADPAIRFYTETFPGAKVETIARDPGTGAVLHSRLVLADQDFVLMEGPGSHEFDFSPAISFIVGCDSQTELDTLWSKLSADPEAAQCGWLRDRFGISWQLVPRDWARLQRDSDPATLERVMKAVLGMKKIDIQAIEKARRGG